jgi:hypothetical protein
MKNLGQKKVPGLWLDESWSLNELDPFKNKKNKTIFQVIIWVNQ